MGRKQTTRDELNARTKANGYKRGAHREEDSRRDCNKQIAMCCKGPLSTPLKRLILMWSFSWHYERMKEDALQKGLPAPDEAAVRELVLAKNVEARTLPP
jgi:hypothetical protein